jgi:hypothetical protein
MTEKVKQVYFVKLCANLHFRSLSNFVKFVELASEYRLRNLAENEIKISLQ